MPVSHRHSFLVIAIRGQIWRSIGVGACSAPWTEAAISHRPPGLGKKQKRPISAASAAEEEGNLGFSESAWPRSPSGGDNYSDTLELVSPRPRVISDLGPGPWATRLAKQRPAASVSPIADQLTGRQVPPSEGLPHLSELPPHASPYARSALRSWGGG